MIRRKIPEGDRSSILLTWQVGIRWLVERISRIRCESNANTGTDKRNLEKTRTPAARPDTCVSIHDASFDTGESKPRFQQNQRFRIVAGSSRMIHSPQILLGKRGGVWKMLAMNRNLLSAGLACSMMAIGNAQPPAPATPAPVMDLEARKASVVSLQAYIEQREKRQAELGQDIMTLDARIEKRVDELVKLLANTRDSQDSKTRISMLKREAIEGLKNGINLYVSKRREMREKIRTGDASALGDLDKFDERINRRVDQIVDIAKSFPGHKDVDKYETSGGDYWNGYYYENSRIREDWKQNRRDNVQSNKTRDDTTKALKDALERLDQRKRSLKDLMANRKLSESALKLYQQELGQIDAYTDHINSQLKELVSQRGSGASNQPSLEEAMDMESMLDDARKDLRQDVANLFRLYDDFARGRAKTAELKENLAARKAWLEKNAPAEK
jgi:hypothetical protein